MMPWFSFFILVCLIAFLGYISMVLYWGKSLRRGSDLDLVFKVYAKARAVSARLARLNSSDSLLTYFEQTIGMLEQMTKAVLEVKKAGGTDLYVESGIKHLAKCLDQRIKYLDRALSNLEKGKRIQSGQLFKKDWLKGSYCYFCSKPLIGADKFLASIPEEPKRMNVSSCGRCRASYQNQGMIRVLSFLEDDKIVHWSQSKEFLPQERYWHINNTGANNKKEPSVPKLVLVSDVRPEDP